MRETVQVETPKRSRATAAFRETPWAWVGKGTEDPKWAGGPPASGFSYCGRPGPMNQLD